MFFLQQKKTSSQRNPASPVAGRRLILGDFALRTRLGNYAVFVLEMPSYGQYVTGLTTR